MGNGLGFASAFVLTIILASGISSACIGEVAGKVSFNISAGSSQTQQMEIFNSCSNLTIYFTTLTQVNSIPNMTTPNVVVSPSNGTLAPHQYLFLNITASMPANAIPGTVWKGATAAGQTANQTSASGANFNVGVVKLYDIMASPPKFNVLLFAVAGGIIAGLVAAGGLYYYFKMGGKRAAKAAKKAVERVERAGRGKQTRRSTKRSSNRR
ncbi:MAG: hypothetical protein M1286_01765 [Candidatus Marsarchaeota archaeon]|nr:hypothetical protein [Candidatus Marsarchaeota archaeon]